MTLEQQIAALTDQVQRIGQEVHTHGQQLRPARGAPLLNQAQARRLFGPAAMRKELGASGAAPLDLSGLKGAAAEIQPAAIPEVVGLPQIGDVSVKQGTVLKAGGVVYRRGPREWEPLVSPASKSGGVLQPGGSAAVDLQPVPGTGSGAWVSSGSFETRPLTSTQGCLYVETSRSGIAAQAPMPIYQYQGAGLWAFIGGMFYRTQAQIAALSATLAAADAGAVVYIGTPYAHRLIWGGAAWGWSDPGDASGRFAFWPSAPPDGWHLADGSTVSALKSDGTLEAGIVLPDSVANPLYLKSGTYGAIVAAVAPTMNAVSAGTPSGTVTAPDLTMDSYTPQGTVTAPDLTMDSYTPDGTNDAPIFHGSALATHQHTTSVASTGVGIEKVATAPYGSGSTISASGVFSGLAGVGNFAGDLTEAKSAGTPDGTVDAPIFTGTPAVLTGTNSIPVFTGTPAVLTGANSIPVFTGAALGTHIHTVSLAGGDPVQHLECPLYYRL